MQNNARMRGLYVWLKDLRIIRCARYLEYFHAAVHKMVMSGQPFHIPRFSLIIVNNFEVIRPRK